MIVLVKMKPFNYFKLLKTKYFCIFKNFLNNLKINLIFLHKKININKVALMMKKVRKFKKKQIILRLPAKFSLLNL